MLIIIEAPGKVARWQALLGAADLQGQVVATRGHVCRSPIGLLPHGIEVVARERGEGLTEALRRADGGKLRPIVKAAVASVLAGASIYIATDADDEGEVIAYDTAAALDQAGIPLTTTKRLRLRGLTLSALRQALAASVPWSWGAAAEAAIPGRCRSLFDRAIGALYSGPRGACGRVLTPLLALLAELRPSQEVGEGWFAAQASDLGGPFWARLPLYPNTSWPTALPFAGRLDGQVVPWRAAGAAAPLRYGLCPPFNTADVIIAAHRTSGLAPGRTTAALQQLYERGIVSYPRTAERFLHPDSARSLAPLAQAVALPTFDPLCPILTSAEADERIHGGLHPLVDGPLATGALASAIAGDKSEGPLPFDQLAVLRLVARRALQAGVVSSLEKGLFRGDPDQPGDLEAAAGTLDWVRETRPTPTWPYPPSPGLVRWPAASQVVELAVAAGLARPSTYSAHVEGLEQRGLLAAGAGGQATLSQKGLDWLDASPSWLRPAALTKKLEALWRRLSTAVGQYVQNLIGAERAIEAVCGESLQLLPPDFLGRLRGGGQLAPAADLPSSPTLGEPDLALCCDMPAEPVADISPSPTP